nr:methyltransferase domain-containing protein [Wenjunlia vitaminophila]
MAVLWLGLTTALGPGGEAPAEAETELAEALALSGLEVRAWRVGQPLPADLRGVEALVLSGSALASGASATADPKGHLEVSALVDAARSAELPLLTLGPAARLLGEEEPEGAVRRSSRTIWSLPARGAGRERGEACLRFAEMVAAGREHAMTRAFFTPRAEGWEKRFPDDEPRYRAAVALLRLVPGQVVLDVGCGTGRALPLLREAVGPRGTVLGTDLTPAMLREATRLGRGRSAVLAVADCAGLPLGDGALHGVFAAGVLHHLPDPHAGLRELARVCAPGARLALFHPVGRAVLAARHGRVLGPDDLLAEPNLRPALTRAGWRLTRYEDEKHRFVALATRTGN